MDVEEGHILALFYQPSHLKLRVRSLQCDIGYMSFKAEGINAGFRYFIRNKQGVPHRQEKYERNCALPSEPGV